MVNAPFSNLEQHPSNPWGPFLHYRVDPSETRLDRNMGQSHYAKLVLATIHGQHYAKSIICAPNPRISLSLTLVPSFTPSGSSSPSFTLSSFDSLSLNPVLRFEQLLILLQVLCTSILCVYPTS